MPGASTRKSSPWQGLFFSLMAVVALLSSTAPKLEQVSVERQALRVAHRRTLFAAFPETLTKNEALVKKRDHHLLDIFWQLCSKTNVPSAKRFPCCRDLKQSRGAAAPQAVGPEAMWLHVKPGNMMGKGIAKTLSLLRPNWHL